MPSSQHQPRWLLGREWGGVGRVEGCEGCGGERPCAVGPSGRAAVPARAAPARTSEAHLQPGFPRAVCAPLFSHTSSELSDLRAGRFLGCL